MLHLPFIPPDDDHTPFPDVELALEDPNGLLAIGGSLSIDRLVLAYMNGIFPWFNEAEPILWWSPSPRIVLYPEQLQKSRSLRKTIRNAGFEIRYDQAFLRVMQNCAKPRTTQQETWISQDMIDAYLALHKLGIAHSVESWYQGSLVGGLYGIALGKIFFGESMFTDKRDASKVALVYLVEHLRHLGFVLIDCQVSTPHLLSLGATEIPRTLFTAILRQHCHPFMEQNLWNHETHNDYNR